MRHIFIALLVLVTISIGIDSLEKDLESKRKEDPERQARLAEIVASYPAVSAYADAYIKASKLEGFDFDEYIKQNPPPSIIFDSE